MFTREQIFSLKVDLFQAYYDCRKHKRNTTNALAFEIYFERELNRLLEEIIDRTYMPGKSVAFLVYKPVCREIFAADFRDRVVHHFLINKLNPIFERLFIYDSYSCRKGKGTLFGIKRMQRFVRSCSRSFTQSCYVLKLDIEGFFMHINRNILLGKVLKIIDKYYSEFDKDLVKHLAGQIILLDPLEHCTIKGKKEEWKILPKTKSLFSIEKGHGLPIGNLTSQIFANVYLNDFDHFVKRELKTQYYGRYVDDFILMDESREVLIEKREKIRIYLKDTLNLNVHPKKEYLQHYTKGFSFLGGFILPYRTQVGKRIIKQFNQTVRNRDWLKNYNLINDRGNEKWKDQVISYVGIMKHFCFYKIISENTLTGFQTLLGLS